jgi:hypothetical protein
MTKPVVRVLWDIENIQVPKSLDGVEVVDRLCKFLTDHGLCGMGIDFKITVCYNPYGNSINKTTANQLNNASVEMIFNGAKEGDADRKIGRITLNS